MTHSHNKAVYEVYRTGMMTKITDKRLLAYLERRRKRRSESNAQTVEIAVAKMFDIVIPDNRKYICRGKRKWRETQYGSGYCVKISYPPLIEALWNLREKDGIPVSFSVEKALRLLMDKEAA